MRAIIFFIILFAAITSYSQVESERDSLYQVLKDYPETDTTHIDLLHEIAKSYADTLLDKSFEISKRAEDLSRMINYEAGIVGSQILYAYYFRKNSRQDTAIQILYEAIKLADELKYESLAFRAYDNLGTIWIENEYYDSIILYYKQYLEKYELRSRKNLPKIYHQLAVANYYLGDLDSAISNASKGVQICSNMGDKKLESALLNVVGSAFKKRGNIDTAIYYFNRIVEIALEVNDKFKVLITYNNLANIYGDRGNNPKALDYYLLALKVAEENNFVRARSVLYNNIAIVYYTIKDYPESLHYLKKSLEVARQQDAKNDISNALNNIGELYLKMDSLQLALASYNEAEALIAKTRWRMVYVDNLRGKAEVFQKMNQKDSAKIYFEKSLELAEDIGAKEPLAKSLLGVSRFYFRQGLYKKSSVLSRRALVLSTELGKVDIIRESAEILHKSNAKLMRFSEAYKYLSLYTKMNDSLLSADNTKEVTQLQMQYEHEKEMQEREAREKVLELQRQRAMAKERNIRNTFIGAFIFVLLIVVLVIRNSRQKHKANQQLSLQKAEIEEKNEEMHQLMSEVSRQKEEIENSHNKITDSIRYARRIQTALFPLNDYIKEHVSDHFVLYEPLEIVSGDFYWFEKVHNHILLAVADCTGHGVPGAMMSMLGISYLNEMARQPHITEPNQVLEGLRRKVKKSLHQTGDVRESRDGMDIAFVDINLDKSTLTFSGANNPLILIRDGEMTEFRPDRQPISVYHDEKPFTNQKVQLEKGDVFYLFSDGFRDQFQGDTGKKYGKKHFRELLLALHKESMQKQKYLLQKELYEWMQNKVNQLDDIVVAGFRW